MTNQQPLKGLLITDDAASALDAMFARNVDVVILRHPDPAAFEAAMQVICTARPELISRDFSFKSERPTSPSELIERVVNSDTALVETPAYKDVKAWLSALKEIAQRANPAFPDTYCSTRSIYDGSFSPLFGYHQDTGEEIAPDKALPWRSVITLIGVGTKIVEERALKAACNRATPEFQEAKRIAEADHPLPLPPTLLKGSVQSNKTHRIAQRQSDAAWKIANTDAIQHARLLQATRREQILLKDVSIVTARPGDMVFIAQTRPKHLWHGSPQYTGGQRLGLVLDHILTVHI